MKKRELMELPALPVTEEMIRLAKSDRGRTAQIFSWCGQHGKVKRFREIYIRTLVAGDILKTTVFTREDLIRNITLPRYEVYISLKEGRDITFLPQKGKWSDSRLDNLPIEGTCICFSGTRMEEWDEPGSVEEVNKFLSFRKEAVYDAVVQHQSKLRTMRLRGRHQKEKAQIDQVMEQVPGLPKDWDLWVYRSAHIDDMYLLYHYGDKENRAYCTACGEEVKTKKRVRHGQELRCPACGAKVTALAWRRQKTIEDYRKPAILQEKKDKDGYVLRIFESKIKRWIEDDWKVSIQNSYIGERYRIFLDEKFNVETIYEYALWKHRWENEMRWCRYQGHYYDMMPQEGILYYRNLKKLRKETVLRYMPVEDLLAHNQGIYANLTDMLYGLTHRPELEYLIKQKLYRLAFDLVHRGQPGHQTVDWWQKKPWEALRIDRQQLAMCIRMNISERELNTLQRANDLGIRLTRQQVEWYTNEIGPGMTGEILANGHAEKTMKYIKSLKSQHMTASDYVDYLDELRRLRIPPTKDVLYPKNFRSAHERTSNLVQEQKDQLKRAEIAEKDQMLQELLPDLEEIYLGTKADDYLMVLPSCKEDFNREGRENHNCVGGSYYNKMLGGECTILFLRRKEEPEKAFCTVEMDGARVVQCRAVRNSDPPQEVKDFMEKYSAEIGKRIAKRTQSVLVPAM